MTFKDFNRAIKSNRDIYSCIKDKKGHLQSIYSPDFRMILNDGKRGEGIDHAPIGGLTALRIGGLAIDMRRMANGVTLHTISHRRLSII